jgi:xanthine/CO dehydrogenase XdhC/CoxF family maturation factor
VPKLEGNLDRERVPIHNPGHLQHAVRTRGIFGPDWKGVFRIMRQLIEEIEDWKSQGHSAALATVVKVWGSAPRPLGSKMAIRDDGRMAGSVSGGCVEAAVCQEAESVLATGEARLVGYGVEDEEAWSLGLSCGGEIEVFIERLD